MTRTLTLVISSREEMNRRFLRACRGEPQGSLISFESPALLFSLLTASRWDLLKAMTGAGSITCLDAAQRMKKDFNAVCADAQALLHAGILQQNDTGEIEFPFDAVHVDFMLKAA